MENKINHYKWQFTSANIIQVELTENGYCGGDAGHGGFVTIKIKDVSSTSMYINGNESAEFELTVKGDTERDTLSDALLMIAMALKKNCIKVVYDSDIQQIEP